MKKNIIYFASALILATLVKMPVTAQKSLEFNQAVLITTKDTVPAGKVWKIESAIPISPVKFHDGYKVNINGQDMYISSYIAGPKYWGNITKIDFDGRQPMGCTGIYSSVRFRYSGYENGLPVINRTIYLNDISSSGWTYLGTLWPYTVNAITEINEMLFSIVSAGTSPWGSAEMRMTVYYSDGTSQLSVPYSNNKSSCSNIGTGVTYYLIGSATSSYIVSFTTPDAHTLPVNFPIWLPEGAVLDPGPDVGCVSGIEFNVMP